MKKNTKLLVFILSVALLIVAAMSVSATEEAPAPEIMAKNVIYGADIRFQFAIDAADFGADKTITVKIYDANPAEGGTLLDTSVAEYTDVTNTNLGVDYAYIASSKAAVSAIAFGQEFWAVAECDGVQGTAIKYSAVEYFLERLYADADSITDIQKAHYQNAIAYGSTAQKVTGDTKTNVADYLYVGAKDGEVFVDGKSVGEGAILLAGDKFVLKPASAIAGGYAPLWKDALGNSIKGTSEITASASGIYGYTLIPMLTFDGMNSVVPTVKTNTSTSSASQVFTTFGDDYAGYNKAFKIYNGVLTKNMPTASIVNEKLVVTSDDGSDYIKIYPTYTEAGYNHTTFEADITFNGAGNIGFDLLMSDNSTAVRFSTFTYNMSTGYFKMNATNTSGGSGNTVDAYLDTTGDNAHTLNLKVDHYKFESDILVAFWLNGTLKYIIDSRLATDETSGNIDSKNTDGVLLSGTRYYPYSGAAVGKEAVKTDFSQFSLNPNSNFSGSISFDNIMFTQTVTTEAPDYNTTLK